MQGKKADLTGQCFGRLTAVRVVSKVTKDCHDTKWLCQCECGNTIAVRGSSLRNGNTRSCGCLRKNNNEKHCKHGESDTRLYRIWANMKARCCNPLNSDYNNYGGRGIKICSRWLNSYEDFKADVISGYQEHLTIDRIDTNGDYEPCNIRWATRKEQANNRRTNRNVVYNGKVMTITQYAELKGIERGSLYKKLA